MKKQEAPTKVTVRTYYVNDLNRDEVVIEKIIVSNTTVQAECAKQPDNKPGYIMLNWNARIES